MELNPLNVIMNTPRVRSQVALSRIQEMLPYMERIGKLRHGVMFPVGLEASQIQAGDNLWMPWTADERYYFRGVRTVFAHARLAVLENGGLRVHDKSRWAPGKPEIDGLGFDKSTTSWEWSSQDFETFFLSLERLLLRRFRVYFRPTVTCQTCGKVVDGDAFLDCGHVQYGEQADGSVLARKPKGGTLQMTATITCQDTEEGSGDLGKEGGNHV